MTILIATTILSAIYGPAWATVALGLATLAYIITRQSNIAEIWKEPYE